VAKLREAERLQAQGKTIAQVCKQQGISDQTFFRWRNPVRGAEEDEAQRRKALEAESARLKKIVAEQALDLSMLRDLERENGEPGAPARYRPLPVSPPPGVGASGLPPARPAPLEPALPAAAARVRAAPRQTPPPEP
jgi:transposase-like protein